MDGINPISGVTIRSATAEDADDIAAVYVRSWRAAYAELLPPKALATLHEANWARRFHSQPESSRITLLAHTTAQVIGMVTVGPDRQDPVFGEINAIYMLPAIQGRGIGTVLLDAAITRLDSSVVRLRCAAENARSRTFYERRGFAPDGATGTYEISGHRLATVRYARQIPPDSTSPLPS
ncbi:GNAT family N-acetyltransferase [Salinispora arenicola]|uniref:GNAT family N-acetyltransferase n=1 Tax=Salinispora arenicola TaxID=168697 RepID=UPI000362ECD1|nr:GNAT family N-acetyltransferase [Salinispora arenicola]